MKVVETISEMKQLRRDLTEPVGFVPTMGYLHEGHLTLVSRAKAENFSVIVSIFVNPAQFGPQEGFARYPRDIPRDLSMLDRKGTDIVFMPSVVEMYPPRFSSWVDVQRITERLEGVSRPGHFRGVATVVTKLFNIVEPSKAYFGQKDAQQVVIVKKMVVDLNMNLEIITVPTVRESDGLAMSSRNTYLNGEERHAAVVLYQALILAQQLWLQGERNAEHLRWEIKELIKKQPLAKIDYVSVADAETLEELDKVKAQALISIAVKLGKTRLIDNIFLK
ncbi:pantoate--beta-alanine ligase [Chloroflexota bacterium]